jgi:hypothetical protein
VPQHEVLALGVLGEGFDVRALQDVIAVGSVDPPQVVHVATPEAAPTCVGDAEPPKHGIHAHAGQPMA